MREVDYLLIGGGIAAARCARALRDEGAEGSIVLVGREPDPPYHRPPASKEFLRGERARERTLIERPRGWERLGVELETRTSVMGLDLGERTAKLSTKEQLRFGQALLATGANVRRLMVDGAQLEGIHYLRTLGNAETIRADCEGAEHVVLVGGSYIACEVAASLTELGHRCTIVMQESVTLERGLGARAGGFFQAALQARGIEVVGGDEVQRFEGDERVRRVITGGGRELAADAVVAGVGVTPDVMLARRAGLTLGEAGGVRTDDRLRASAPGVYAAGDICEYDSPIHGRAMRIEHEDVAGMQGITAARNMLGADRAHVEVPYFFSDLSDWASLEYVGPALSWDEEIVRGSIDDGSFSVLYLGDGRLKAALAVGRSHDLDPARALIASGSPLDGQRTALADPDEPLPSPAPS